MGPRPHGGAVQGDARAACASATTSGPTRAPSTRARASTAGFHGEVAKALAELDGEDLLYEHEGAVWLKTTAYGDDKDRVLIRSSGEATYFLSDIAYHRDKMDRGFAHMIDIWGADHHGYVPRMKAAFTALPPHDPERLELIIGQFVNLLEGGEQKRMSKRKGTIVTVDDLVDAIGVDATRFTMVSRSHDTPLDIDLELVVQQSSQNPVYYVQYAHARICSILRTLEERTGTTAAGAGAARSRWRRTRRRSSSSWRASRSSCSRPPSSGRRTGSTRTSASWRPSSTSSTGPAACSSTTPTCRRSAPGSASRPGRRSPAGSTCSGSSAPESM